MSEAPQGTAAVAGAARAGIAVSCEAVSFDYEEGRASVPALRDVSVCLRPGVATALLGPTGSGKSTLLQVIRGLLGPQSGSVTLDGVAPGGSGYSVRRREIGLVFQMPEAQLFAATAHDDVAFGPRQLGWTAAQVEAAVDWALDVVGLPAARCGARHPHSFSGGEQRRLALAGVLAMRPRLLLLDEPFVSLDPAARRHVATVLASLRETGIGLVVATHDIDLAWELCPERIVLADGGVIAAGDWAFAESGTDVLLEHRLRPPFLVNLWQRLGRPIGDAPRSVTAAVAALA